MHPDRGPLPCRNHRRILREHLRFDGEFDILDVEQHAPPILPPGTLHLHARLDTHARDDAGEGRPDDGFTPSHLRPFRLRLRRPQSRHRLDRSRLPFAEVAQRDFRLGDRRAVVGPRHLTTSPERRLPGRGVTGQGEPTTRRLHVEPRPFRLRAGDGDRRRLDPAGRFRPHAVEPHQHVAGIHPLAFDHADPVAMLEAAGRPRRSGRGVESARAAAERGRLDRVILALAYCAMLRRSEIAALAWGDVDDRGAGLIRVRVRRSKRNPDGAKVDLRAVVGPFADALREHRAAAGAVRPEGRVVPLGGHQIGRRIAAAGRAAGIDGLTGHSPRRAMATELARRRIDSVAIARAGGWSSVESVKRYTNEAELEHGAIVTAFGARTRRAVKRKALGRDAAARDAG